MQSVLLRQDQHKLNLRGKALTIRIILLLAPEKAFFSRIIEAGWHRHCQRLEISV